MNKKSMSSQAVGGAVGHNPISIISLVLSQRTILEFPLEPLAKT